MSIDKETFNEMHDELADAFVEIFAMLEKLIPEEEYIELVNESVFREEIISSQKI